MSKKNGSKGKIENEGIEGAGEGGVVENDDFLVEGLQEVSTAGAAIYKPEVGLAEGKDLYGIAYCTALCLGGVSDSGLDVWEAIVFQLLEPTIAMRGEEQVIVEAGEDVLIANNVLLADVARRADNPRVAQIVKLRPKGRESHATKKGWEYWDFRIALGKTVDRAERGLIIWPERPEIHAKLAEFEKKLKAANQAPLAADAKILSSYHRRMREVAMIEQKSAEIRAQQLTA